MALTATVVVLPHCLPQQLTMRLDWSARSFSWYGKGCQFTSSLANSEGSAWMFRSGASGFLFSFWLSVHRVQRKPIGVKPFWWLMFFFMQSKCVGLGVLFCFLF